MLTKYNKRTVDELTGAVIGGATVSFFIQGGGPANVYSDVNGSSSLGSEIPSDSQGRISVFMHPGLYRITVTIGGSVVEELQYVAIYNVRTAAPDGFNVALNLLGLDAPASDSFLRINQDATAQTRTFTQTLSDIGADNASNLTAGELPAGRFTDATHGERSGGDLHELASPSAHGFMSSTEHSKLTGIESGATANESDAFLLDRANHTGTQTLSTISDAGNSAGLDVGAGAGTVAAGDDARLSDAREWSRSSFGDTASRPTPSAGATWVHFDTDLGYPVFWDGDSGWVDATGASA
jgi:hypothetical protein